MRAYERFLKYIAFDTTSNAACEDCPSTPGQKVLGAALVEEMKELGIEDARMDENGYVYGSIPANTPDQPAIGLIAHMDTVDDAPALPMKARIEYNYQGGDIAMDEEGKNILSPADYPCLEKCVGEDLIHTDGNTLLGADDKAGIAEIMTLAERLLSDPSIPHGRVAIGFTPDEEIGRGADRFDVKGFGAEFAYTVDGGLLPEIEYENFNAASASMEIRGLSIHPGSAKGKMKNAALIAAELIAMMPAAETPACTEGYEGFYHLTHMDGEVEHASLDYIIRDHDREKFAARKAYIESVVAFLNKKYGEGTVTIVLKDSYYNMKETFEGRMHVVRRAEEAMRGIGMEPEIVPIRGGTDGARLSFMGLPCPNLPTGGMNAHGRFECVTIQSMDKMVDVLTELVRAPDLTKEAVFMNIPVHTVSAGGLVLKDNLVLLQRSQRRGWEFPGGMVDEGEGPIRGLIREIQEETGVIARPLHFVGSYTCSTRRMGYGELEGTMLPAVVNLLFLLEYVSGEARVSEENLEVEWVPREEALQRVTYPSYIQQMKDMLAAPHEGVHFRRYERDDKGNPVWLEDVLL